MTTSDERPATWVGHIVVNATDISESADFYVAFGMREIVRNEQVCVLELRGGTHLVVVRGEPAESASFDLMVEDVDAVHAELSGRGLAPADIERGNIHDSFTLLDPAGTRLTVNSSHVVGTV